jgi:chromosome segregation ATPase
MKGDYEGQLSTLGDKTSRQAKELDLLYKKVSELQSELASKVADFELEKDKAITAARQEEAKRQEATLADQKQKIDMFLSGRGELQKRCDEYLQELTDAKETQKVANEQVAAQIAGAEAESSRLRQKVSELREESTKAKEGVQEAQKECEDLKKRNTQLSELNEEQASQLSIINNERTSLKGTVRELELETSQHHQQRQMMFKEIAERVKSAVDNEFDQLANKLDIVSSGPDQGK